MLVMSETPKKRTKSPNSLKVSPKPRLDSKAPHTTKQNSVKQQSSCRTQHSKSRFQMPVTESLSQQCINHPNRKSEFVVSVTQKSTFCESCAIKLAAQGFRLNFLRQQQTVKKQQNYILQENVQTSKKDRIRITEVSSLLNELKHLKQTCSFWCDSFSFELNKHYASQLALVEDFYSEAVQYLVSIKIQHLKLLTQEFQENRNLYGQMQKTLFQYQEDTQFILSDVEGNLQEVLHKVGEQDYRKCMDFYVLRVANIQQDVQRLSTDMIGNVTCCDAEDMREKIKIFKDNIDHIFGIQQGSGIIFSFEARESTPERARPGWIVQTQALIHGPQYPNPAFKQLFQSKA